MKKPAFGLCLPVELVRVRDGDTVEVRVLGTALTWAIRLQDVWAPELRRGSDESKAQGQAAKEFLENYVAWRQDLALWIPLPVGPNILAALTFDRLPGVLWSGGICINELMVEEGYASSTKGGRLGE
jgi:endonuclease YncB( thermonuclease family)